MIGISRNYKFIRDIKLSSLHKATVLYGYGGQPYKGRTHLEECEWVLYPTFATPAALRGIQRLATMTKTMHVYSFDLRKGRRFATIFFDDEYFASLYKIPPSH